MRWTKPPSTSKFSMAKQNAIISSAETNPMWQTVLKSISYKKGKHLKPMYSFGKW